MVYRDATGATSHQGSGSPGAAEPSYRPGREGAVNALSDERQEALSLLAGQGDSLAIAGALGHPRTRGLTEGISSALATRGRGGPSRGKRTALSFLPVNRTQRLVSLCWRCRCVRGSKCHCGFPLPKHKQRQGQGLAAG